MIHKPHPAYALSRARYIYINLGSTDGRLTGCLASHTTGDNMCLLWIRMIDERTRWATFSADLRLLTASLGRSQGRPLHRPRARLPAGAPAVWHHTHRVVPYGAHTAGRSTSGRHDWPPRSSNRSRYRAQTSHGPSRGVRNGFPGHPVKYLSAPKPPHRWFGCVRCPVSVLCAH